MVEDLYKLKLNNNEKIVIIKNGVFYYCFDEDAYILSYLMKYKIIKILNKDCVSF